MKIKYIKDAAGIKSGFERDLPDGLAKQLINMGVVEEVKAVVVKEASPELDTKEDKSLSKRKTKNKK